jgi:glycosyltransferase involved in cell wall biosynthesis
MRTTVRRARLRVGIDVRLAHWPGVGRYIEEIVGRMVVDFPATDFVLLGNADGPTTLNGYVDPRLQDRLHAPNVCFVPCAVAPFTLAEPWLLARSVQAQGVQVMHSPYINIPWLPRAIPLVVTLHDFRHPDLALQLASPRTWAKRAYYEALTRLALARSRRVVCVSQFLAGQVRAFRPRSADRVDVITHAASGGFSPLPDGEAAQDVAAHFRLRGRYALFVGTLKPHKNLLALLEALALPGLPPDLQLAVAAAPDPRYPEVLAAVARLGLESRVRFLGHVPKERLPALYGAARVTVLPSAYESFGLPMIESMACGTPVIAAPLASLPEVGGTAAWYSPPIPQALNAALQEACFDELQHAQRSQAGMLRARAFSWKRAAASLHAVYQRAARAHPEAAPIESEVTR